MYRAVFTKLQQIRHKRKMIVGGRVPELEHRPVRETCSVSPHELRVRLHLRVFTRQQIGQRFHHFHGLVLRDQQSHFDFHVELKTANIGMKHPPTRKEKMNMKL